MSNEQKYLVINDCNNFSPEGLYHNYLREKFGRDVVVSCKTKIKDNEVGANLVNSSFAFKTSSFHVAVKSLKPSRRQRRLEKRK